MKNTLFMAGLLLATACGPTDPSMLADGGTTLSSDAGTSADGGALPAPTAITGPVETGTWAPTGAPGCDYLVTSGTGIFGDLSIEAGTTVCFEANAQLQVRDTGSLAVNGTAEKPVTFKGRSDPQTRGFWGGVWVRSNNARNVFSHLRIIGGGGADYATTKANIVAGESLVLNAPVQLSLDHVESTLSLGHGVALLPGARFTGFTENSFSDSELHPVRIPFNQVSKLDSATHYGSTEKPNGRPSVRVEFGAASSDPHTLRKLDVAWGMSADDANRVQDLGARLTVEKGARLEFEANSGLKVLTAGTLIARGTADEKIVFTGKEATKGFWKGIGLLSPGNALEHAELSYAGNDDSMCCGFFEPMNAGSTLAGLIVGDYAIAGDVSLSNVRVINSKHRGVSKLMGTVTDSGGNDFTTGNVDANLGL